MKSIACALAVCGLSLFATGCGEKPAPAPTTKAPTASANGHSHGAGPHGGAVADWGGGAYHVEFMVDHDKKEATVYVLGSDGKSAKPIKAEKITLSIDDPAFQIDLAAQPMEGESDGASSRFVGQHENLGIVREFAGSIAGEVDGTPYAADFAEVAPDQTN
jgi:hypothetical protein